MIPMNKLSKKIDGLLDTYSRLGEVGSAPQPDELREKIKNTPAKAKKRLGKMAVHASQSTREAVVTSYEATRANKRKIAIALAIPALGIPAVGWPGETISDGTVVEKTIVAQTAGQPDQDEQIFLGCLTKLLSPAS